MDLQIERLTQSLVIWNAPNMRVLFEQVVEVDTEVNLSELLKCAAESVRNPNVYFFAFIEPSSHQVVGFLWCVHSLLKNRLVVYYMSVLPEYQQNGILHKFFEVCKGIVDRLKLDPMIELYSLHGNIAEAYGATPSRTTIWEFDTKVADYGTRRRHSDAKDGESHDDNFDTKE